MTQLTLFQTPSESLAKHASPNRVSAFGPRTARVMVVGPSAGEDDIKMGTPFAGSSGRELKRMLAQAGIDPSECFFTNVFMTRPKDNKIENYCGKKADVGGAEYPYPPLTMGKYLLPELLHELPRLAAELREVKPELVLALGNVACWALLGQTGINKMRGNKFTSTLAGAEGFAVIPTHEPVAVLRQWDLRVIVVTDFLKGERFLREGFKLPQRRLLLDPTLAEIKAWTQEFIWDRWRNGTLRRLPLDIETKAETITMIGFASGNQDALCIPFFDPRKKPTQNYWPTLAEEYEAYTIVKEICESEIPKLGQNGLYDIQYLYRYGIKVINYTHDTMIKHHALFPELEKGLGFMGSVYTDEAPWKLERNRNKDNFRQDDE